MSHQEVARNIDMAEQVICVDDDEDIAPQNTNADISPVPMDIVPQSIATDQSQEHHELAEAVLRSCWDDFASQNELSAIKSADFFAKTVEQLQKRGLLTLRDFATAPVNKWPSKMTPRLIEMIQQRAQRSLTSSDDSSELTPHVKRMCIRDAKMEVDTLDAVQNLSEGRSSSSIETVGQQHQLANEVDMQGGSNAQPHMLLSSSELMDIHLVDAIVKNDGMIEERRQKYIDKWRSTFVGVFCIHPPQETQDRNIERFKMINNFEFFLWSNIKPQPKIDYIKKKIMEATGVRTSEFKLETMCGEQLPYDGIAKDIYERLVLSKTFPQAPFLAGKLVLNLRIVPK